MAFIGQNGGQPAKNLNLMERFRLNLRYLVPTEFAYALGFLALFGLSGVFAAYAQRALPGQTLYGAKIALEQTHVRFVSNPANRAQVQMELAGRRLEEAGALESSEGEEKALRQFSRDIKEAQNTLKQAGDPVQVKAATRELAKKAKEYEEKLSETKSKKPVRMREVDLAAMKEAEDILKEIQLEEVEGEVAEEGVASDETKTEEVKEEELKEGEVSL